MFSDILGIIRIVLDYWPRVRPVLHIFIQPIITIGIAVVLIVAITTVRTGGVYNAMSVLLYTSETPERLQGVLRAVASRDKVIHGLLDDLLSQSGSAARARLAIIHNHDYGLSLAPILRYDITHVAMRQGYAPGPMTANGPVGEWSFLAVIESGHCIHGGLEQMTSTERFNLEAFGASYRLVCPATDYEGHLLGAIFVTWAADAVRPTDAEMVRLQEVAIDHGRQIAAAINAASY